MTNNELSIAVAEKVMVWSVLRITADQQDWDEYIERYPCVLVVEGWSSPFLYRDDSDAGVPWRPAEDIAQAWQVVERMREREQWWFFDTARRPAWRAYCGDYTSESESCSEAICLAALKAVEGTR